MSSTFLSSTEPSQPRKNASGMETMPGLLSGKIAKLAPGIMDVLAPETTGDSAIRMIAEPSPPYMLQMAPWVVNLRQYSEYRMVGRLAEAATAKARATRNATFCPLAKMPPIMASTPMTTTVRRATLTSVAASALPLAMTLA